MRQTLRALCPKLHPSQAVNVNVKCVKDHNQYYVIILAFVQNDRIEEKSGVPIKNTASQLLSSCSILLGKLC